MRSPRHPIAMLVFVVTAVAACGWSFAWPWREDSTRFCDALRAKQPDHGSLIESLAAFVAIAPPEIRRDAEYVHDFTRALLTSRFPGASGPGVAVLAMNPDFVAAQERIGAYVKSSCGVAIPGAASTADATDRASPPSGAR